MTDNFIDFITGSFIGLLAWFFGGMDGLIKVLLAFAVIDHLFGVCAACFEHRLSSSIGFRGIARKVGMFMLVGLAHLIDEYIPGNTGSLRAVVCLFYIINEGISIIENTERMGITIPKPLHNWLMKMHLSNTDKIHKKDIEEIAADDTAKSE